jgi:ferric-dicitrate binding protein FerR (iron transport regulator)
MYMEPNNFPVTDLLQKYLNGTITETESAGLFALLRERAPENDGNVEAILQQAFDASFTEQPALSADASKRILDRLMVSMENTQTPVWEDKPVRRLNRPWVRYAAAAVLLLAVGAGIRMLTGKHTPKTPLATTMPKLSSGGNKAILKLANGEEIVLDSAHGSIAHQGNLNISNDSGKLDYAGKADVVEYHTLSTPRGGQYKLQLPDGTDVWLNAASSITYPTAFTGSERKVKITGEAYFEVAKNKEQAFKVNIDGRASVEVLGTSFNVNAYTDENSIHTTLLEGSVKMVLHQQAVVLKPGQQALIVNDKMSVTDHTDLDMVMSWKNGSFQFDHARLDEVLKQMARWYDVEVAYEHGVPDIIFSGEIKRNLDLPQALTVLSTMGVRYRIEGRKLTVMP